nr:ribonuclease H-like domain-containing protein [Tanacetum cinerariifolium]
MEEQSFIATIYQKTNPALFQFCLFSCSLSQVEPKKISDALQDPSWLCREFEALMHEKFQMSDMGELNLFLGLQVLRKEDGIFLSQDKYVGDILKKIGYSDVRSSNTPMDKEIPWGKDGTGKDTIVVTLITEAEYVAAASGCGQVLWIQNQLLDYGLSMPCEALSKEISSSILHLFYWDSVVNMCMNFLHGSDSEQMTHEFIHVYLAFASVYVWIG